MSCYGNSSFDRWLEGRADEHYGCNEEDGSNYRVYFTNPNIPSEHISKEVFAEDMYDAWHKVSVPYYYRPLLKNGKRSKAKETFFTPNEEMGWIKIGKKTVGTIIIEE